MRGSFEKCEELKHEIENLKSQHEMEMVAARDREDQKLTEINSLTKHIEKLSFDLQAAELREAKFHGIDQNLASVVTVDLTTPAVP